MRVLVASDERTARWSALLASYGYQPIEVSLGLSVPTRDVDVGLVVVADGAGALAQRFWLAHLTMPLLLITRAPGPALTLCGRVPFLRLIAHVSRANRALDDLIQMTCEVRAGIAVLGPLAQPIALRLSTRNQPCHQLRSRSGLRSSWSSVPSSAPG